MLPVKRISTPGGSSILDSVKLKSCPFVFSACSWDNGQINVELLNCQQYKSNGLLIKTGNLLGHKISFVNHSISLKHPQLEPIFGLSCLPCVTENRLLAFCDLFFPDVYVSVIHVSPGFCSHSRMMAAVLNIHWAQLPAQARLTLSI